MTLDFCFLSWKLVYTSIRIPLLNVHIRTCIWIIPVYIYNFFVPLFFFFLLKFAATALLIVFPFSSVASIFDFGALVTPFTSQSAGATLHRNTQNARTLQPLFIFQLIQMSNWACHVKLYFYYTNFWISQNLFARDFRQLPIERHQQCVVWFCLQCFVHNLCRIANSLATTSVFLCKISENTIARSHKPLAWVTWTRRSF